MKDNRRVIIVMNNKEPSLENYQKGNIQAKIKSNEEKNSSF